MLHVDRISVKAGRSGPILLREASFNAAPGRFLAVLGPNGSGKSTLLKAIGGELPVRDGSIRWKGVRVQDLDLRSIARERAFLDQHGVVPFAFTAREVVMMGRYPYFSTVPSSADEAAVDRAMAVMHVEGYQDRPMPLLSGGERQRAHIARTIAQLENLPDRQAGSASGPSLWLLDEPLNDLDIAHQHVLLASARAYAERGHCVVAVLHDVNLAAQYAHQFLLLRQGRILAQGSAADVLQASLLGKAYGMPAHVGRHPFLDAPWVHFGAIAPMDAQPNYHYEHTSLETAP
jgi:iron complex transport system ATP-binding protein